jgi:hypothetical protein
VGLDRLVARAYHAAIDYCLDHSRNPEEFIDCLMEFREMGLQRAVETLRISTRLLSGLSESELAEVNEKFVARVDNAIGILDRVIDECVERCDRKCESIRSFLYFDCLNDCAVKCIWRRLQ